jgi:subtilisin family serine protease
MKVTSRTRGLAAVSLAALGIAAAAASTAADRAKTYIVQMKSAPLATYEGGEAGLAATKAAPGAKFSRQSPAAQKYAAHLRTQQDQALASVGGGTKVYSYDVVFNGFAAELSTAQAEALRARSDVLNVWEDERQKPQTNSTPFFLHVANFGDPWSRGFVGEDVVVGIVDSGIQPDHPSLRDIRTRARGLTGPLIPYDAPPADWTGTGCDFGNTAANPNDAPFTCNNKLLKAASYRAGYVASGTAFAAGEFLSARDSDGHGTHTATTAAGNSQTPAEIDGEDVGPVHGIAPRARVAVYKVCWDAPDPDDSGCFTSDSMAGINQAVEDGVDVINFSIGGAGTSFLGADDIAHLFAVDAGVFVAVSGGNDGPGAGTIGTPSGVPWVTASAALEDDENFGTGLRINAPASVAGTYEGLEGGGPVRIADTGEITASVVPSSPANGCTPLTNGAAISGNIALVIRGVCDFIVKYNNAAAAGARAIVVYNDGATPDRVDPITMAAAGATIPGIMIRSDAGFLLAGTPGLNGTLSPDISIPRVDRITGFSSRGPNNGAPDIIKPDISAPGVDIIAGETLFPNAVASGGQFFQHLSGTSMASPHTAGVFALLKQAHPDWTPAMARSAIMTTARTQGVRKSFGPDAATPFDMGAGVISPREAFNPGLVYDAGLEDYLAFLCGAEFQAGVDAVGEENCAALEAAGYPTDSSDLNLPSIGIADLVGTQTIRRTVTNVGDQTRRWRSHVEEPPGVDVRVQPESMVLAPGQSATFEVTFTTQSNAVFNQWAFGKLLWFVGSNYVYSPIAVRPIRLAAPAEVRAEGSPGEVDIPVQFGYSGDFNVAVNGLVAGTRRQGTLNDGAFSQQNFNIAAGTTLARFAMYDEDNGNGANDHDLQVFFFNGTAFVNVGNSGGVSSEEEVNVVNPAPGTYAVLVIDFATPPGPTPFTLFQYSLNGTNAGNTTVVAPAAVNGTTGEVNVSWPALPAATRHLGILNHREGTTTLRQTELLINTQ